MEKNSPVNSVYLVALAVCALVLQVNSLLAALIYAAIVVAVFLISISIVSMIEKIADKNVRFLMLVLVSAVLITVLKIVLGLINLELFKEVSENLEFAILPCIMLAIVPLYLEDTLTVKELFKSSFLICGIFVLMLSVYGVITEVLGFGAIAGQSMPSFDGIEFFRMPYGAFMVIATLAVLFNIVRRAHLKKKYRFDTLVERYKVRIRGILETEKKTSNGEEQE